MTVTPFTTQPPPEWTPQEGPDVYLGDVLAHLRRYWRIIAGVVLASLGIAFAFSSLQVPTFRAAASLRIDENQPSLPVLNALQRAPGQGEIPTEMAVLHSRSLAEEVVDSLALQVVVLKPSKTSRQELFADVRAERDAPGGEYVISRAPNDSVVVDDATTHVRVGQFNAGAPIRFQGVTLVPSTRGRSERSIRVRVDAFEDALAGVIASLDVSRLDRDANVVLIRFEGPDRHLTRDVPNAVVRRFLTRRENERRFEARATVKLLREQRDSVALQLARAENELRIFRERSQSVDLATEAAAQVDRLANLQAERNTVAAERDAIANMMAEVRVAAPRGGEDAPSPYRRMLAFPTLLRNPAASELLRSLAVVEDQRANLRTRRTAEDPDVRVLSARLAELEEQVQSISETYVQGLSAQVTAMDATLARSGQSLGRIPGKEVQFARLQRGPKVLDEILSSLQTRLKEAEIAQSVPDARIKVVDLARLPRGALRPNLKLNLALALVIGFGVGGAAAVAYGAMHRTIRTLDDLKAVTNAPVLGMIPRMRPRGIARRAKWAVGLLRPSRTMAYDAPGPAAEAYRALRTNITHRGWVAGGRTLLFTSPRIGDGKTTSSVNTALALTQQGVRVLLVDADLRRGALHHAFGVRQGPGLAEILTDRYSSVEELLQHAALNDTQLDFITSGAYPSNPAELLGSQAMAGLLARLKREYDVVVIDTPPVNLVTDAAVLSPLVDGIIVVTRAGATGPDALAFAIERLQSVNSRVIGVVLNAVDFRRDARSYGIEDYAAYYAASGD
jgi:polysaccharide biosynthesis transport protein